MRRVGSQLAAPRVAAAVGARLRRPRRAGGMPALRAAAADDETSVERYWAGHTVRAPSFVSRRRSLRYLDWRFEQYPLFREFCGLWGEHGGETVLDLGCGPGNDLVGLAVHSAAERIVGVDVSRRALELAAARLALHGVEPARFELIQVSDSRPEIPLADGSVDYGQSLGVLHHTSDPEANLRELHRVLRPGGRACVMVYNRDSVWFHLYTAYVRRVLEGAFEGLDADAAFARNTDGPDCPISRAYAPRDFLALCAGSGFEADYVGGYLSQPELRSLRDSWASALADARLAPEHRGFLRELSFDRLGLPLRNGYHAGIGGVFRLRKPDG